MPAQPRRSSSRKQWLLAGGLMLAVFSAGLLTIAVNAQPSWKLVWSDEFNAPKDTPVDLSKWTPEVGGQGWGNNELQFYTGRTKNAYQDGTGFLVIKAIEEKNGQSCWYGPCQYTSARLITKGKIARKYGRFEVRMQIPFGQGIWPAFWLLGSDIDQVGWPNSGEIDVMENIGREPKIVHGTIHGPGYSGADGIGLGYYLTDTNFSDQYHRYAIEWEPNVIRWYVNDVLYQTRTPKDLPDDATWVFDKEFYLLLNLAVGGNWSGRPDNSTVFPQSLKVDYVRVYER